MSKPTWSTIRKVIAALLIGGGITISVRVSLEVNINEPPLPAESLGWAGPEAIEDSRALIGELPEFRIVGQADATDNRQKSALLWHFTLIANNGEHLPNYPQQVGDCVAFGVKNAIETLQCIQIYREGLPQRFRPIFPSYIYGTSRIDVGKGRLGNGDGSVGAWAAKAVQDHGVLFADEAGVPEYSGTISRQWGSRGVPEEFKRMAREFPVKTIAQIKSAQQACDALVNGYPVTIASNFGTRTIRVREVDGRMVGDCSNERLAAKWDANWSHQMCLLGYECGYFYVLNSWGAAAHPRPLNGEPPGGFWITWSDCERIVKQGDSWAFSDFEGFPAKDDIDFTIIGDHALGDASPLQEEAMKDICTSLTDPIRYGVAALIAGLLLLLFDRHRCRCAAMVVLSLAFVQSAHAGEITFDVFGVTPQAKASQPIAQNAVTFDCFGIVRNESEQIHSVASPPANPAIAWLETHAQHLSAQGDSAFHRRYLTARGVDVAGLDAKQLERLYAAVYFGMYEVPKSGRLVQECVGNECRYVWRFD